MNATVTGMELPHAVCNNLQPVYHTGTGYSKKINTIENANSIKINT